LRHIGREKQVTFTCRQGKTGCFFSLRKKIVYKNLLIFRAESYLISFQFLKFLQKEFIFRAEKLS